MNTPIEALEMSFPLRVDCYELIPDSGGQGKYRGGLGTGVPGPSLRTPPCDRLYGTHQIAPFGVAGGGDGSPSKATLKTPTARNASSQARGLSMSPPASK